MPKEKKLFLSKEEKLVLENKRELIYQHRYIADLVDRDADFYLKYQIYKRLGLEVTTKGKVYLEEGYLEVEEDTPAPVVTDAHEEIKPATPETK